MMWSAQAWARWQTRATPRPAATAWRLFANPKSRVRFKRTRTRYCAIPLPVWSGMGMLGLVLGIKVPERPVAATLVRRADPAACLNARICRVVRPWRRLCCAARRFLGCAHAVP